MPLLPPIGFFGSGSQPAGSQNIVIGTVDRLSYSGSNSGSYTFNPGPTVDGGGAALLLIAVWCTAHGQRDNVHDGDPDIFTLNGVSYDQLLFRYLQDTGINKYVQAAGAIWDSPSSGDVVFDMFSNITATGCGMYFMNLTGLNASPLGVPVQDQVTTGTGTAASLAFQATTTAANSLLIAINGCRTDEDSFTFDDTNFTSIGGDYGTTGAVDGTFNVGYQNQLAADTYDCGGSWEIGSDQRIAGGALELKAA